jgi:hypothetical protein
MELGLVVVFFVLDPPSHYCDQGIKGAVHGPAVPKPVRRLDFTINDAVVILQSASGRNG